jgi:hypothetical protein
MRGPSDSPSNYNGSPSEKQQVDRSKGPKGKGLIAVTGQDAFQHAFGRPVCDSHV